MNRFKVLEKKMSGDKLQQVLNNHNRWRLATDDELNTLKGLPKCTYWIKIPKKGNYGLSYNPSKYTMYTTHKKFKHKVCVVINEPKWFYYLRKWLGL